MTSQTEAPADAGESIAARAAAARAAAARANAEAAALADAAAMEAAAEAAKLKQAATAAEVAAQSAAVEAATYKQKALDSSADLDGGATAGPAPDLGLRLLGAALGRAGTLVGVGLIAVGVVQFPPGPLRSGLLLGIGIVLVLASAFVTEVLVAPAGARRPSPVRVLGSALLLGLSAGSLTGGVLHHAEFPLRCAFLIPLGLLGSFLAHTIRHRSVLEGVVSWVGGAVAVVTLASFLLLFGTAFAAQRAAHAETTTGVSGTAEHATTEEHAPAEAPATTDEHATTDEPATEAPAATAEPAAAQGHAVEGEGAAH